MGGHQVTDQNPGDDGFDEDGYDESQRAEILEVTREGPNNGTILVDLDPDFGEEIDADEEADTLDTLDEEGEEDER